ncbi:MAG: SixA phosphatase family protein [Pyrinomonadaceae bacterium]
MKTYCFTVTWFMLLIICISNAAAQKKTIILVRHAEKETSAMTDTSDPVLSTDGAQRAERLRKLIGKYRPGAVFSTDYKRTRATAGPIAKTRRVVVEIYDPKNNADLIDRIMKSRTKRFVVVGHSNTIPDLANLLTKKELFKNLDDAEYGVIWVIRLKDGRVKKTEILQY